MNNYLTPTVATEKHCKAPWSGGEKGKYFRCGFCGHRFKVGDTFRMVFTNDMPGAAGNPLICSECDGPNEEVRAKWAAKCKEFESFFSDRWWYFTRYFKR